MKQSDTSACLCPLWIDHANRIISFRQAKGFETLYFPSQAVKLAFAIEKCACGYRIQ